jgi:peptidoglycan hydrolase-like protein with peptidoglycan-binding domain
VPERVATIDSAEFEEGGLRSLMRRALGGRPLDAIGLFLLVIAAGAILINALYRQPGPHPAPIFAVKPRPVATEPAGGLVPPAPRARPIGIVTPRPDAVRPEAAARLRADIITDIQRELSRRGLYDGPVDGMLGPKTDAAIRDFETTAKLKPSGEPTEDVLRAIQRTPLRTEAVPRPTPRPDPIADLIAPSPRVTAVQRALNDFGYGPVKATGQYGPETIAAIQKFERDRKLPVTGQISPRLMRELAALTGRPLE